MVNRKIIKDFLDKMVNPHQMGVNDYFMIYDDSSESYGIKTYQVKENSFITLIHSTKSSFGPFPVHNETGLGHCRSENSAAISLQRISQEIGPIQFLEVSHDYMNSLYRIKVIGKRGLEGYIFDEVTGYLERVFSK